MHLGGKIEVVSKMPLKTRADLSMAYTPGVARICDAIARDPENAFTLTIKKNTVAVVTDGTAVLGLGDIGPAAAMPVMEGKAMLFKEFAGVDAFPICLNTKDPDEIVRTVKTIATTFGGINLEDISAPRCFRDRRTAQRRARHSRLSRRSARHRRRRARRIDQRAKDRRQTDGSDQGRRERRRCCRGRVLEDRHGRGREEHHRLRSTLARSIAAARENMNWVKDWYAQNTNPNLEQGTVHDVIKGADVFLRSFSARRD